MSNVQSIGPIFLREEEPLSGQLTAAVIMMAAIHRSHGGSVYSVYHYQHAHRTQKVRAFLTRKNPPQHFQAAGKVYKF
jgi:hypothetical protein